MEALLLADAVAVCEKTTNADGGVSDNLGALFNGHWLHRHKRSGGCLRVRSTALLGLRSNHSWVKRCSIVAWKVSASVFRSSKNSGGFANVTVFTSQIGKKNALRW